MNQLVLLKLGVGSLQTGFPAVTLQMGGESQPHERQIQASLPPAPHLAELYRDWQLLYLALYSRLGYNNRIIFPQSQGIPTNISEVGFREICQQLRLQFNQWLSCDDFRPLDRELRTHLTPYQEIQVIVETDDLQLRRFPWHLWDFFQDFRRAEVALSTPRFQRVQPMLPNPTCQVRVLAILGNSAGLDLQHEQALLSDLPQTHLQFLAEPTKLELSNQLWGHNWDIFFFAGHSTSSEEGEVGVLQINPTDNLTISDLENALRRGIEHGLQLAIFNSCDGLGIIRELEKLNLQIPQVIVMREPVPDRVAQAFLTYFLKAYSQGQSLYLAVREARERLQTLESLSGMIINSQTPTPQSYNKTHSEQTRFRENNGFPHSQMTSDAFPCASWLPVICQNPAVEPPTWNRLRQVQPEPPPPPVPIPQPKWKHLLATSLVVTGIVTGVRSLGGLQGWELRSYDQVMRLRPAEKPSPRLLVVEATEADIKTYGFPLPDATLAQVLERLQQYQPRVIGLDIFRDSPIEPGTAQLAQLMADNLHLIGICSAADASNPSNKPGIAPPPSLPKTRLGYSDVVFDPDRIIRRHLMFMQPAHDDPCTTNHSLSMRLALTYLAAEGITPQTLPGDRIQIGNPIFTPLNSNSGPYQNFENHWGVQVFLNYRQQGAQRISITDLLQGNVDPSWIQDRVILVGMTAPISSDYFSTPYSASQWPYQQMPGVLIQAQMTSQVLSAVLDGRPIIQVGTPLQELLWIWGWSCIGGVIAGLCCKNRDRVITIILACAVLWVSCWGGLILGFWLPFVPAVIVLVILGGITPIRSSLLQPVGLSEHKQTHPSGLTPGSKIQSKD